MKNDLLIWNTSIAEMINNGRFGGIDVQLLFWAKTFIDNGWNVHALTTRNTFEQYGIKFHHVKHIKGLNSLYEWRNIMYIISKIRPQFIFLRGAQRVLYPLNVLSRIWGCKVVFFGASDVNFVPGKASVGTFINRWMYETGIKMSHVIITQNTFQQNTLFNNYNRKSLQLLNIWQQSELITPMNEATEYDAIWVANFRRLKRPEWFIELAKNNPQYSFLMIGGDSGDTLYYSEQKENMKDLGNGVFLGKLSFEKTTKLISKSKVLICTSEYEGFPNTFLQAWSTMRPVISTVDPNLIISTHNIGIVVDSQRALQTAFSRLVTNGDLYSIMQNNIDTFFKENIDAQIAYNKLIDYINA